MPSVDELLDVQEQQEQNIQYLEINADERTIEIPDGEGLFGVVTDKDVERRYFRCPQIVGDNIDLSQLKMRINYQNASGNKYQYEVDDMQQSGGYITFSWVLEEYVFSEAGTVLFSVSAIKEEPGGTEINKWNTTIAQGTVLQGLVVDG